MTENEKNNETKLKEEINLDDFNFDDVIDFDPAEEDYVPEPVEAGESLEASMTDIDDIFNTNSNIEPLKNVTKVSFEDLDDEIDIDSEINKFIQEPNLEIDKEAVLLQDKSFLDINEELKKPEHFQEEITAFDSYKEIDSLLNDDSELSSSEFGSFEPDEAEEEVSLSDDELGDILDAPSTEEEEEPIALSLDELNDIGSEAETEAPEDLSEMASAVEEFKLEDEESEAEVNEDFISEFGSFEPDEAEEEVSLSDDELGDILNEENFPGDKFKAEEEKSTQEGLTDEKLLDLLEDDNLPVSRNDLISEDVPATSILDENLSAEEEPIALSTEELENLGEDFEEDVSSSILDESLLAEEEPITLSADELNLIGEEATDNEMDSFEDPIFEPEAIFSDDTALSSDIDINEGGNELSSEDIDELLGDIPGETLQEMSEIKEENFPTAMEDIIPEGIEEKDKKEKIDSEQFFSVSNFPLIVNMDEYANEGEKSLEEKSRPVLEPIITPGDKVLENITKVEMKEMMTYLDNLLGNLPDDTIREFTRSNYFNLYKKLMQDIGL